MQTALKDTFFSQYGRWLTPFSIDYVTHLPFKQHAAFPVLTDIFNRKHQHHVQLSTSFSKEIDEIFLHAFLHYLNQQPKSFSLQPAEWIWLDLENTLFTEIKQASIEKDFETLLQLLNTSDQYLYISLTRADLFSNEQKRHDERFLRRQMAAIAAHPRCRIILVTSAVDEHLDHQFAKFNLPPLTEQELIAILKQRCIALEHFHEVTVPENIFSATLSLVGRYLSTTDILEKALLLIDSSMARKKNRASVSPDPHKKLALSMADVLAVLADWTFIPASHLQVERLKHTDLLQNLSHEVVGQDIALAILKDALLQMHIRAPQCGPLGCFLFAGPPYTGKKTAVFALAKQLFGQHRPLYFAQPTLTHRDLLQIPLQSSHDQKIAPLAEVIQHTPYAVIFFEQCETFSPKMMEDLQALCRTGYSYDEKGRTHDFRQSMIICSITLDASCFGSIGNTASGEDKYTADLMQIVMNDQQQMAMREKARNQIDVIAEKIMPALLERLPGLFCREITLIPFLPLDKSTIEKIIRLKLKILGKQLNAHHHVELGYAPEVIRYLASQWAHKKQFARSIVNPNDVLKSLYLSIEEALSRHADSSNHSDQLFVQLNEIGEGLTCDWLPAEFTLASTHRGEHAD